MADIRELDPETVDRIAAGEVVERPASVVKELVENSVDADASRVEVAVEAGGKGGIRVTDDGVGMTEREVRRAVEKHTTSKLRSVEDLAAGVSTLGFRGEALHAIGAVSRTTVRTRPRASGAAGEGGPSRGTDRGTDRGTELVLEGGEVVEVRPVGCPEGTAVEVEDLFYNVPARRKYLKRDATEFAHADSVVTGYALANPDVAVSLTHDGREAFATEGRGDLRAAVMAVYGREVAEAMVPVAAGDLAAGPGDPAAGPAPPADGPTTEPLTPGPLEGVSGLVSHPETNRASRDYLDVFVNGRYVTASAVREAVVAGYGDQLAPDRFPFAALFLSVPGDAVDVNVHPRKLEVRFADEDGAREQVRAVVRATLLDAGLVRSSAPRGRSRAAETAVSREEGGADAKGDGPAGAGGDRSADEGDDGDPRPAGDRSPTVDRSTGASAPDDAAGDGAKSRRRTPPADARNTSASESSDPAGVEAGADAASRSDPGAGSARGSGADARSAGPPVDDDRKFRTGGTQATLGEAPAPDERRHDFDSLPALRVLGQFRETYVVCETDDGLLLVDQHAADERVRYERLRERFGAGGGPQALAEPVEVAVTAREAAAFDQRGAALARLGVRAERTGERAVEVRTLPALLAGSEDPALVRDLLSALAAGDPEATVEAAADRLLADLACHPAITGNESLTEGGVVALLSALDDCENPYACPHGRPVLVELSDDELDDRFERDYPGHACRRPGPEG